VVGWGWVTKWEKDFDWINFKNIVNPWGVWFTVHCGGRHQYSALYFYARYKNTARFKLGSPEHEYMFSTSGGGLGVAPRFPGASSNPQVIDFDVIKIEND
jgi:hypothetical protein